MSGENEDRGVGEGEVSFKWKSVRGVNESRQNGSERLVVEVHVSGSKRVHVCVFAYSLSCLVLKALKSTKPVSCTQECKEENRKPGMSQAKGGYLTRRCALRESFPPTDVTLHVYVPMSPDQVWEMWRVPSASSRMRGMDWTLITEPSFSQTCLEHISQQACCHNHYQRHHNQHLLHLYSFNSIS